MSARTKARKRALDLLYSAEVRSEPRTVALAAEEARLAGDRRRESSWGYARDIVLGVDAHIVEKDELIETYALGWEIAFNPLVPVVVAISEAVEAARTYSTEDSAGFVNGLLGRIAQVTGRPQL